MNPNANDIELAPGWPISKVERSLNSEDATGLVKFLASRHQDRFFEPIDCLKKAAGSHLGYGFSMMSLCCLLIETIQCFREGLPTTNGREWQMLLTIETTESVPQQYRLSCQRPLNGTSAFQNFFRFYQGHFPGLDGGPFYDNVRNGLLHQAQTKAGWKINIKYSSVWDQGSCSINRNLFAVALRACFDAYLEELRLAEWSNGLWINAARKIWWLIRKSRP